MADTPTRDAPLHRLWYEPRAQAFFENGLREDIIEIDGSVEGMIWRVRSRYAEHAELPLTVNSALACRILDGILQHSLLKRFLGSDRGPSELQKTELQKTEWQKAEKQKAEWQKAEKLTLGELLTRLGKT